MDDTALKARLLAIPPSELLAEARALRDAGHGSIQSFSPKVFIPLTKLCRDYCHYCTFSRPLERGQAPYLTPAEVLEIARQGAAQGCTEALFTLGDKPELRHPAARAWLESQGYPSTIAYLADVCGMVLRETGLLPHVNAGVMGREELALLRPVSASQGLMLETVAARLGERGGPHYRSPDKVPTARIATIRLAGELAIPFTSGILIGIGETREERLDALIALRNLHREFGHIQEVIVQNFRAKANTPMADAAEPDLEDLLWTIAAARIVLGPAMHIQAPPNLSAADFPALMQAGINDWGGVSPVTPDHVNPEAPWPELARLEAGTAAGGRVLVRRLPVYPGWQGADWIAPELRPALLRHCDADGWGREDRWFAGDANSIPPHIDFTDSRHAELVSAPIEPDAQVPPNAQSDGVLLQTGAPVSSARWVLKQVQADGNRVEGGGIAAALLQLAQGQSPTQTLIETLFAARGDEVELVCQAADDLRRRTVGDAVGFVVNRNINYTNICAYACGFCAFSKGKTHADLRGSPYDLDHGEITRRVQEAAARGASEVCLQGGIHPSYTGETYLSILRIAKAAVPGIHVHAFSPLEVSHGAQTLGLSLAAYLAMLKREGLGSLPGTAAEILCDDVREVICPDKLNTAQWLEVIRTAHQLGLKTTATMMFGHVESPPHWARHLLAIRELQAETGGITEFVPLPFVHMEAPLARKGLTRAGPTWREVRLMHAVARLVLHPLITNIQTSWTKLGPKGAAICLQGGANDLGGTLMNESISRAAGAGHGQELPPSGMDALITGLGRTPRHRTTLYGEGEPALMKRTEGAPPLAPVIQTPPRKRRSALEPAA